MSEFQTVSDLAFERFREASRKIESIKKGIEENRNGEVSLTDIQTDTEKLSKRIARENMPVSVALERINGVPNFQDVQILYKILKISRTVARITIKTRYGTSGYGTGFLIAPGLLITNNHVFPDVDTAANSTIQFNYELDENNVCKDLQTYSLAPEKFFLTSPFAADAAVPDSGLDFTIVAVAEISKEGKNISDIPHTVLDETLGKIIEGENCVIIQHPKGDYKKTVLKDIRMLTLKDDFLIYESDTLPGSSGAVVIGLGTGEVVALHHSSIPNKNAAGQWLRKDGTLYQDGDADETIDWLGNEGVRVSSLLRAVRNAKLSPEMDTLRDSILRIKAKTPTAESTLILPKKEMKNSFNADLNTAVNVLPAANTVQEKDLQYFEVELSAVTLMQQDWRENYKKLFPGIVSSEMVFPLSTIASQRAIQYVTLRSGENPWETAAKLEALPHIRTATPDLEIVTDWNRSPENSGAILQSREIIKPGNAAGREDDFKAKWSASPYFDLLHEPEALRSWNRTAIGLTPDLDEVLNSTPAGSSEAEIKITARETLESLAGLRLIQLDTGYTDHAKIKNRFNFFCDEDFIDGSDARDEPRQGIRQQPGHGSRVASLITGGDISTIFSADGNRGLLCNADDENLLQIIPYRIAENITLLNRGKNLADAVNLAVQTGADILLSSLSTYPRTLLAASAKAAYDAGIIWTAAAGNSAGAVLSPAVFPATIAVAASNPNGKPWRYSCYGEAVDISAPGEDVYVPAFDENHTEIMIYDSGTGYAAAQVAAGAALWLAKNRKKITELYSFPWQRVEAFRLCLKKSATCTEDWDTGNFGAGIVNISKLLQTVLPTTAELFYAYQNYAPHEWDLGVREAVHFLWSGNADTAAAEESFAGSNLTARCRVALTALTGNSVSHLLEADTAVEADEAEKILRMYFKSFNKA